MSFLLRAVMSLDSCIHMNEARGRVGRRGDSGELELYGERTGYRVGHSSLTLMRRSRLSVCLDKTSRPRDERTEVSLSRSKKNASKQAMEEGGNEPRPVEL
jgi:hypothetical protein